MLVQSRVENPSSHPHAAARLGLFISLGLYRSASTWTFNVAAEILSQTTSVLKIYGDDTGGIAAQIKDLSGDVLVKVHRPDEGLRLLIQVGGLPTLLSVRDPLDCVASLMRQFGSDFESGLDLVGSSCDAILAVPDVCRPLVLRYETGQNAATVMRIASALGRAITPETAQTIAARLEPHRVRAKIDDLIASGTLGDGSDVTRFDPETHWHPNHLGSGRSGTYADMLSPPQIAAVLYRTRMFRHTFGYENASERPRLAPAALVAFGRRSEGVVYCGEGFSVQEEFAIWTHSCDAELILPLQERAGLVTMTLVGSFGPFSANANGAAMSVFVNGLQRAVIPGSEMQSENHHLTFDAGGADRLDVRLRFDGLLSPAELGASADTRRLGLYLVVLTLACKPPAPVQTG